MSRRLALLVLWALGPLSCGKDGGQGENGVTTEESQSWAWSRCGTIMATPAARAALFSPDGRSVAVLDDANTISLYDVDGATTPTVIGEPGGLPPAQAMAFSPDGTRLATVHEESLVVRRVPDGALVFELQPPTGIYCRADMVGFSATGDYVFTEGGAETCVWRASDGTPVSFLADNGHGSAVVRGETVVTVTPALTPSHDFAGSVDVLIRDFAGQQLASRAVPFESLGNFGLVLSPAGDRFAVTGEPGALFDVDTGAQLLSPVQTRVLSAAFTYRGDRVVMGDGLFRTQDGNRLGDATASWFVASLAPDGETEVEIRSGGGATLRGINSPGYLRLFGNPTRRAEGGPPVSQLAISADGTTLVSQGQYGFAFGLRLAPRFEDSTTLWWASHGEGMAADISADGRLVALSGDNRRVVGGADGRSVMNAPAPPDLMPSCWRTQLRLSPTGRWAAGAGYGRTMDVFDTTMGTDLSSPFLALGQTNCQDAAAFSVDERLMATSGPTLYATGAAPADWHPLWRARFLAPPSGGDSPQPGTSEWGSDVRFSPDGKTLLVSRCADWTCKAKLYAVADGAVVRELPQLTAPHPAFSGEGHWVVAGGALLHLPSGNVRQLAASAAITTAIFTPNGDIIAGLSDFSLTRYCRTP